ncbi:hypothetical protein SUGI_1062760 [Cryptomeria japonica]|uniref:magnesium transporter MRS2-3 n=1 Tax=Cryptomeria japonica TaxID=3369 RepID=UPI002414CB24|nr:magnesium transporter MRS2-3 [Cryptomeria japonica]GLJ49972.1 hypothetical protein SUGI_1062760 [Cryptomeria japonica]
MRPRPRFSATRAAINGGGEEEEKSAGRRKKGVKAWLLLDEHGNAQVVEVGKNVILRRTALNARDLRILDPLLSYPCCILGRERAIVINLEYIRAIITANEVLLLNSRDPAVAPFAAHLQLQLSTNPAHQV